MKAIRTQQRFRCDHCKKTATEGVMKRHERICYLNPDRECETCDSTGILETYHEGIGTQKEKCPTCYIAEVALERKNEQSNPSKDSI